jgi:hypothetical protein
MPGSALWGWLGPLLVTAFGTFLRFNQLNVPDKVIFDETYYVPDALGILRYGVEHNYVSARNSMLVQGNTHIFTPGGEFVVHPRWGSCSSHSASGRSASTRSAGGSRRADRVAGHPAAGPDRPADDPVHPARLHVRQPGWRWTAGMR